MTVREIPVASLSTRDALPHHLVAADGVTLLSKGERLDPKRIELLRQSGFETVYSVADMSDVQTVRKNNRIRDILTENVKPHYKLAEATNTADGKMIFAKGRKCDDHALQVLRDLGVETIRVDVGSDRSPESENFLAAIKILLAEESAAKQRKRNVSALQTESMLCHKTVQIFLDAWNKACRTLISMDCKNHSPQLGFDESDSHDFSWVALIDSICNDSAKYWVLLSIERTAIHNMAQKALCIFDEEKAEAIIPQLANSLSEMFFDESVRTAPRVGLRLQLAPTVSLCEGNPFFDLTSTQALRFPMDIPQGEISIVFGVRNTMSAFHAHEFEMLYDYFTH